MSVREQMEALLERLEPDWKAAADKLMKKYSKKTQEHFQVRAYLRAVAQGNQAQATHVRKNVLSKKMADEVMKGLIDMAGKNESKTDNWKTGGKWYTTPKGQKKMLSKATGHLPAKYKVFAEIMSGPNPLSQAEIKKLIQKRPDYYEFLKAYVK